MTDLPDDLKDLDRLLTSVQFEPRASLGVEVAGRWLRGERGTESPARGIRRLPSLAGVLALFGLGLFTFWFLLPWPRAVYTKDRCCQDLDGGGDADDGLLVVTHKGRSVQWLAIYEDRDGSMTLTPGDAIRFQRAGRLEVTGPIAGARTVEFCCLDYDGGGPADDVLLVVGQPPDRISMAAIYERFGPPGVPMELR